MKILLTILLFLSSCTFNTDGTSPNTNTDDPKDYTSVADFGILPDTEISELLETTITKNPNIDSYYFPKGEYQFKNFSQELAQKLSGKKIYGDENGLSVFHFPSDSPHNIEWSNVTQLSFYNIAWRNARIIITGNSSDIRFVGNIFYGLTYTGVIANDLYDGDHRADHMIVFGDYSGSAIANNLIIQDSVFLRSANKKYAYRGSPLPNKVQAADETDPTYMIRREYGIRILTASNITISNNVFGLTSADITKATNFAKTAGLKSTLARAESLLKNTDSASIYAKEQNFFTTSINTLPNSNNSASASINDAGTALQGSLPINMARNIRIIQNMFNGWFSRDYMDKAFLPESNEVADDNRFFDHAVYLRGTENTIFGGNYIQGYPNDSAGGVKLKSGASISIVKNYLDNTGLIFARDWELGGSSGDSGKGIYFNVLVADNFLDITDATGSYKMGITYDDHEVKSNSTDKAKIENGFRRVRKFVITDNQFSKMSINTPLFTSGNNSINNPTVVRLDDFHPDLLKVFGVSLLDSVKNTGFQIKNNTYVSLGDYSGGKYFQRVTDNNNRVIQDRRQLSDSSNPIYLYPEASTLFADVIDQHNHEIDSIIKAEK